MSISPNRPQRPRRLLYFGGNHRQFDTLFLGMVNADETSRSSVDARTMLRFDDGMLLEVVPTFVPSDALETLRSHYVSLLVLDLRSIDEFEHRATRARELLDALDHAEDLELRYGFHRILALLPGCDNNAVDAFVLELGARGVRHTLRDPCTDSGAATQRANSTFAVEVLHRCVAILRDRKPGKVALCASGGGITGIYFELGALKCIADCLPDSSVNNFDMFFGISAGAVVSSLLATGFSIDEILAAIAEHPGGRIAPLSLSLAHLGHVNTHDFRWRIAETGVAAARWMGRAVRREQRSFDDIFTESVSLLGAPFNSYRFEKQLRGVLTSNGGTNEFGSLRRPLFVGATDQDAKRHVLFGDEGFDHVPVSRAVQASMSIHPAFGPTEIGGRFYEDGAITQTSDFTEAITKGASLVFVLDPFVPYVSDTAGLANRRGLLYNIDQDIRTMSYTRFETTRNLVLRRHPEVSTYTFLPSNRQRRLLSMNPMDHRPWAPIWKAAYLSTLQRIDRIQYRLAGDLAEHGMALDTARAREVAYQLEEDSTPTLASFFSRRKVVLRTHA